MIVNPPYVEEWDRDGRCQTPADSWGAPFPPVTIASIAGHLRSRGYDVTLFDAVGARLSWSDLQGVLEKRTIDVVVINTATPTIENDLRVASLAKKYHDCIAIAIGGFPSALPEECFSIEPNLDLIIKGEDPERPIEKVLEGDAKGDGIITKSNTSTSPYIENDLNCLGIPAYDLLPDYRFPLTQESWTFIFDGRGCSFNCRYCIIPRLCGGRFRWKSNARIVDEVEYCRDSLKIRLMMFWSECFSVDKERVITLCQELKKREIDAKFLCTTRVDMVDPDLLGKMYDAGFRWISFGIESGSQQILDKMNKRITLEQSRYAVKIANEAGLKTIGHFILGLPGETEDTLKSTLEFSREIGLDFAQFYTFTPFPGSELYDEFVDEGWKGPKKWEELEQGNPSVGYMNLSTEEIRSWRRRAYYEFYFRPTFISTLMRSVSLWGFLHLGSHGIRFLRWWHR